MAGTSDSYRRDGNYFWGAATPGGGVSFRLNGMKLMGRYDKTILAYK